MPPLSPQVERAKAARCDRAPRAAGRVANLAMQLMSALHETRGIDKTPGGFRMALARLRAALDEADASELAGRFRFAQLLHVELLGCRSRPRAPAASARAPRAPCRSIARAAAVLPPFANSSPRRLSRNTASSEARTASHSRASSSSPFAASSASAENACPVWQRKRTILPSRSMASTPWHSGQVKGRELAEAHACLPRARRAPSRCGSRAWSSHPRPRARAARAGAGSRTRRPSSSPISARRQLVVDLDVVERVERHRADQRVGGLLHDRGAAAQLDGPEARGAVVERAGEHHADRRAGRRCRPPSGTADRPPGGSGSPSARARADGALLEQHVMVVGRDVDAARLDAVAVLGVRRGQRPGLGQDPRQDALRARREVPDHEHRCRQSRGQARDQLLQRFHAAGGGADHDDVLRAIPEASNPSRPNVHGLTVG